MKVYSKTDVGLVREKNEDSILLKSPKLFAVADGVGGFEGGEIASKMALEILDKVTEKYLNENQPPSYALRKAVSEANAYVYAEGQKKYEHLGMGTTLTAIYIEDRQTAHVVQIGDSRLYRFRSGHLEQITCDQTLVNELLTAGKITEGEAKTHPQKNWLSQALGSESIVQADVSKIDIEQDDVLLLCSDGLSDMVSDRDIEEILRTFAKEKYADKLVERALQNGGKDNVSVIVLTDLDKEDGHGNNN